MTYLNLLGGGYLYSFIVYCLLLHVQVLMLCHCYYAKNNIELKKIELYDGIRFKPKVGSNLTTHLV